MQSAHAYDENTVARWDQRLAAGQLGAGYCYPVCYPSRIGQFCEPSTSLKRLVPAVWIEQTTYRLQGGCSTAELSRHIYRDSRAAPSLQRPVLLPLPRH
jgi:hypothetical protein